MSLLSFIKQAKIPTGLTFIGVSFPLFWCFGLWTTYTLPYELKMQYGEALVLPIAIVLAFLGALGVLLMQRLLITIKNNWLVELVAIIFSFIVSFVVATVELTLGGSGEFREAIIFVVPFFGFVIGIIFGLLTIWSKKLVEKHTSATMGYKV